MAEFVSINTFEKLFDSPSELLTDEGIHSFKARLLEDGEALCQSKNISKADFDRFVHSLDNPSNIIYYGWVAQNNALIAMLEAGIATEKFVDQAGHLKHRLGEGYRQFLSPYIAERLLQFSGESKMEILTVVFSFLQLLDSNHAAVVEGQLFKPIQEKLTQIKRDAKGFEKEQDLIELVKPVCADEYISCVNYLSKSSYALKLGYVDDILNVIWAKSCTVRFANWILKRMEDVKLNREHEHKITDLRRELKNGEIEVRNHGSSKTPIRWKNLIMTSFIILIAVFIFYIIYFKPFSEVVDPQFTNNSSFTQFTKEDRKKIDSLLREMNGNPRAEDLVIDQGVPIIGGRSTLTLRKSFNNPTMERVYADLIKDADLKENGFVDSCSTAIDYKRVQGVKDLNKKKGKNEAMIKNESYYDVVLFVSENRTNGETYSLFLKKGETTTFEIDKYNTLMAVPGNEYQNYTAPFNSDPADRPSQNYDYHFCETDVNYRESINTVYQVMYLHNGKTKFMLMGDKGSYFHLIDINGVLEQF